MIERNKKSQWNPRKPLPTSRCRGSLCLMHLLFPKNRYHPGPTSLLTSSIQSGFSGASEGHQELCRHFASELPGQAAGLRTCESHKALARVDVKHELQGERRSRGGVVLRGWGAHQIHLGYLHPCGLKWVRKTELSLGQVREKLLFLECTTSAGCDAKSDNPSSQWNDPFLLLNSDII